MSCSPLLRLALTLLIGWPLLPIGNASAQTYATVAEAAKDPDFAVQGEYVGVNRGMQVIARGDGDFELVIYEGGLPGAGWDRQPPRRLDGDEATVGQLIESLALERTVRQSPTLGATPPPGAIVLFDGTEASVRANWAEGAKRTDDGLLIQGVTTREKFGDYRLHLEFQTPYMPQASGQGRGNSGVYHQGRYETQVLDSFGLEGKNNEAGGIYTVSDPDQNVCYPPLAWQTYDIDFTAARFDEAGKKISPARLTVRLNGVVVQNDVAVPGPTTAAILPETAEPGPLHLQDHGNPVRYRNIWLLPRDLAQESRRPIVPGFERFFAGTGAAEPLGGQLLVEALACGACHAGALPATTETHRAGPDLSAVAGRVRHGHLVDFIAAPHDVKPGTSMPDPWSGSTAQERNEGANAIAQFLISIGPALVDELGDEAAAERGQALFHQIGCVACHAPQSGNDGQPLSAVVNASDGAVPLGDLGAKYTLDALTNFLADPLALRPHGRMPRLAASPAEARDLATHLLRDVVVVPPRETLRRRVYRGRWEMLPDFESLQPIEEDRVGKLDVNAVDLRGNFGIVYDGFIELPRSGEYLFRLTSDDGGRLSINGETVVDHDGIHPATERVGKVNLEAGVQRLKIEYFEGGGQRELGVQVEVPGQGLMPITSLISTEASGRQPVESAQGQFRRDASLVERGRELFVSVGCNRCHAVGAEPAGIATNLAPNWEACRADRGCLAADLPRGLPDYDLTDLQRRSIGESLRQPLSPVGEAVAEEATAAIHRQLLSLNCYACHVRDGVGGPEGIRRDYFQTTTPEMGDEGRLPPLLTGVGDKLNDAYLVRVLSEGANLRPYMKTRMPGFGEAATKVLSRQLMATDRASVDEATATDGVATTTDAGLKPAGNDALTQQRLSDGRVLAGNDGLACIKCHTFGGVGLAGIQAIDALQMPVRLREAWFHRYLLDPQKYRPGTRMPASFPDGKSVVTKIADGRPADQSAAMWAYFSQGERAKPPAGLYPDAIELRATERPLIYRNFITGLSPRGIAVAYPHGVNLAWDASRMALTQAWKNAFIDAGKHWIGRGPGAQEPLGDAVISIDRATPVALGVEADKPWPVSDDPQTWPRFIGYRLDADGNPTFRYQLPGVMVEDQPLPVAADDTGSLLSRSWKLTGTGKVTLLGGAGQVTVVDAPAATDRNAGATYLIDGAYRVRLSGGRVERVHVGGRDELRVTIDLGRSESTATLTQQIAW